MKNKKERESFVDNPLNWETAEETTFTRTLKLRYKGEIWLKVQTFEWSSHYDFQIGKLVHAAEWINKGFFTINDLFECMNPTTRTEIIEKMTELDKERPDRASAPAIPSTMDIERKGK